MPKSRRNTSASSCNTHHPSSPNHGNLGDPFSSMPSSQNLNSVNTYPQRSPVPRVNGRHREILSPSTQNPDSGNNYRISLRNHDSGNTHPRSIQNHNSGENYPRVSSLQNLNNHPGYSSSQNLNSVSSLQNLNYGNNYSRFSSSQNLNSVNTNPRRSSMPSLQNPRPRINGYHPREIPSPSTRGLDAGSNNYHLSTRNLNAGSAYPERSPLPSSRILDHRSYSISSTQNLDSGANNYRLSPRNLNAGNAYSPRASSRDLDHRLSSMPSTHTRRQQNPFAQGLNSRYTPTSTNRTRRQQIPSSGQGLNNRYTPDNQVFSVPVERNYTIGRVTRVPYSPNLAAYHGCPPALDNTNDFQTTGEYYQNDTVESDGWNHVSEYRTSPAYDEVLHDEINNTLLIRVDETLILGDNYLAVQPEISVNQTAAGYDDGSQDSSSDVDFEEDEDGRGIIDAEGRLIMYVSTSTFNRVFDGQQGRQIHYAQRTFPAQFGFNYGFPLYETDDDVGTDNRSMSEETILRQLITRKYVEVPATDKEGPETCVICLSEYEDGEAIGGLHCGHEYHMDCITKWVLRKNCCPLCKTQAVEEPCEFCGKEDEDCSCHHVY